MSLLKQIREATGLTQREMAEKLGIDPSSVSRWERGVMTEALSLTQVQILEKILAELGLTFNTLPAPTFTSVAKYKGNNSND